MDLWIFRLAQDGLSFEAIDTSAGNKRVGVLLCTVNEKGIANPIDEEMSGMEMDKKMIILFDILHDCLPFVNSEIFGRHQCDKYFEGVLLSVLSGYGGKGIAGKLIQAAEEKALELQTGLIYICASSEFTANAVAKRGFHTIYTLPYEEYRWNGQRAVLPKHPHVAMKSCIKLLKWLIVAFKSICFE